MDYKKLKEQLKKIEERAALNVKLYGQEISEAIIEAAGSCIFEEVSTFNENIKMLLVKEAAAVLSVKDKASLMFAKKVLINLIDYYFIEGEDVEAMDEEEKASFIYCLTMLKKIKTALNDCLMKL